MSEYRSAPANPVTAIILAAGTSSRFPDHNKLLKLLHGIPVIDRTIQRTLACGIDEVVVVTGFQRGRVENRLNNFHIRSVFNPDFESGMASSIACGVREAAPDRHLLIWPGDMPLIKVDSVVEVLKRGGAETIVVPIFEGRRGHPVFFDKSFRVELIALRGTGGARPILNRSPESVVEVPVLDPGVIIDVDTASDLRDAARLIDRGD